MMQQMIIPMKTNTGKKTRKLTSFRFKHSINDEMQIVLIENINENPFLQAMTTVVKTQSGTSLSNQ